MTDSVKPLLQRCEQAANANEGAIFVWLIHIKCQTTAITTSNVQTTTTKELRVQAISW